LAQIEGLDLAVTYQQCADKPELALRVLRQFLAHYRNMGEAMMEDLHAGELEEPRRKLHSLRGAAGAVGATSVQEAVLEMQAAIRADESMARVLALGETLRTRLDALIASLTEHLAA
jgi:HPt (histidine-containing phosphotransfer) domain-containing protein